MADRLRAAAPDVPDAPDAPPRMIRIATVGLDGSGKTSIAHGLRERLAPSGTVVVINCPRYHETPGHPYAELSRGLQALSDAADTGHDFPLKASALFLQMALYGRVEAHLVAHQAPSLLISDRHPVVDTLAYGPLYERMSQAPPGAARSRPLVALEREDPEAFLAVAEWHARQCGRFGCAVDHYELTRAVVALLDPDPRVAAANFGACYETPLPDAAILIEIAHEEALRRSAQRLRATELHQSRAYFAELGAGYERVLAGLEAACGLAVHRLDNSTRSLDEAVDEVERVVEGLRLQLTTAGRRGRPRSQAAPSSCA